MKTQYFGHGALRDKKDRRDYRIAGITPVSLEKEKIILKEKYPPKNQYSRGSCTSQGQSHHKERQEDVPLSARFIMSLTKKMENNVDYGAYTRNTFKVVKDSGALPEIDFPEPGPEMSWEEYIDHSRITEAMLKKAENHKSQSFWRVENNPIAIKAVLKEHNNSIEMSMDWYTEFNNPGTDGKLSETFSNYIGGHAVEIVGIDDFQEEIHCKNSWGKSWGNNGFFKMSFATFNKVVMDLWTSLDIPADLSVDNYYGLKRNWASYLRERAVAFNPWLIKKIGRLPNNREIKGLAYGYWDFESVFLGKNGDIWLHYNKPEAIKLGLIIN